MAILPSTIQLNAGEAIKLLAKTLAPGAVLLSREAVDKLYDTLNEVRSREAMQDILVACGGIDASLRQPTPPLLSQGNDMSDDVKQLLKVQLAKSERAAIDCENNTTRYLLQADEARASAQRARAFASELRKMLGQGQ